MKYMVPILLGDPELCKRARDQRLHKGGLYVQPIDDPTVPLHSTPAHHADAIPPDLNGEMLHACPCA